MRNFLRVLKILLQVIPVLIKVIPTLSKPEQIKSTLVDMEEKERS